MLMWTISLSVCILHIINQTQKITVTIIFSVTLKRVHGCGNVNDAQLLFTITSRLGL